MWSLRLLARQCSYSRLIALSLRNFSRPLHVNLLPKQNNLLANVIAIRKVGMFSHGNDVKADSKEVMPLNIYEKVSEETLENLADHIDKILEENYPHEFDVSLSNGVLNVHLAKHGTYVINKQTPNRQIWLSSPTSGPKRYDFVSGSWVYSHDGVSLHNLLASELSDILNQSVSLHAIDE